MSREKITRIDAHARTIDPALQQTVRRQPTRLTAAGHNMKALSDQLLIAAYEGDPDKIRRVRRDIAGIAKSQEEIIAAETDRDQYGNTALHNVYRRALKNPTPLAPEDADRALDCVKALLEGVTEESLPGRILSANNDKKSPRQLAEMALPKHILAMNHVEEGLSQPPETQRGRKLIEYLEYIAGFERRAKMAVGKRGGFSRDVVNQTVVVETPTETYVIPNASYVTSMGKTPESHS